MKTTDEQLKFVRRWLRVLTGVLVLLIVFLLIDLNKQNKKIEKLDKQMEQVESSINSMKLDFEVLKNMISSLKSEQDSIKKIVLSNHEKISNLNDLSQKLRIQQFKLKKEVEVMKNEIRDLNSKVDSLEKGQEIIISDFKKSADEEIDSSKTKEESIKNFHLNMEIEKISNIGEDNEDEISLLNYNSPLTLADGNFMNDEMDFNYDYINENSDSLNLNFQSSIEGKNISVGISKNNEPILAENKVFISERTFGLGTKFTDLNKPLQIDSEYEFISKSLDPGLKRKGNRQIVLGVLSGTAGGVGLWYFSKNPIAEIDVSKEGNSVFSDQVFNEPMRIVSGAAIAVGTVLVVKGIIDRKGSITLTPNKITFKYKISPQD